MESKTPIEVSDEDKFLSCPGAVVTIESAVGASLTVTRLIGILARIAMKHPGRRCQFKVVLE
jgi:hypothetical protein